MCGICGYLNADMPDAHKSLVIEKMLKAIAHRGVNGTDYITDGPVTLGFNRLSIIGVNNGMQPITSEDGSLILVCNGEIYNYKEIKKDLIERGHKFKTESDVEVILHLYEEKGLEVLDIINGQFAFALYDKNRRELFCARDHVGVAPFFYTSVNGTFVFGSEIKAIFEFPGIKRVINPVALDQIMTFPSVVCPETMFKGINSLETGHYLVIHENGSVTNRKYWDLDYPKCDEDYPRTEEEYIEGLNEVLTKAVELRLQAEVPVGFYISGGLDSSIIACKIHDISNEYRHSFSVNFEGDNRPEKPFQEMMADHVNSIHHERLITIDDIADYLPKAVYHSESTLKETYNTASLILSEMAHKEGIKVVLTGEGADELFAGYVGYQFDAMRAGNAKNNELRDPAEKEICNRIWGDPFFFYEKDYGKLREYKSGIYSSKFLMQDDFDCLNHKVIDTEQIKDVALVHKRSYIDIKLRLSEHLLAGHGDRAGLANSVEARYPFLDRKVMEYARKIPPDLKLRNFKEKYILKKMASAFVPSKIINRPKYAFVAPGSAEIIRKNKEYVIDILSYDRIKRQGFFNPDEVERLKKAYLEPGFKLNLPYDNDTLIIILTFGILLDTFKADTL
ncbi:asparagine synthase (glutamine-hydrolysing) [Lachnospiraceae bacterium YSD2013]|nr:asparagine synthase (glutamine-hydrolysing) [Lachnospiraceae bacterium YSD2013]